jgi:DNA-directed RNA polymerase subunit RPC12/RpoP
MNSYFGILAMEGEDYQNMAGIRGTNNVFQDYLRKGGTVAEPTVAAPGWQDTAVSGFTANGVYWLRLDKEGTSYTGSWSADGERFTELFRLEDTDVDAEYIVLDAYKTSSWSFGGDANWLFTLKSLEFEGGSAPGGGSWVLADSIEAGRAYVIVADGKYAMTNAEVAGKASYAGYSTTRGAKAVEIEGDALTGEVTDDMIWTFEAAAADPAYDGESQYFLTDASGKYLRRGSMSQRNAALVLDDGLTATMRYYTWSFRAYDGLDATYAMYVNSERAYGSDYPGRVAGDAAGFDIPGTLEHRDPEAPFAFMNDGVCSKITLYVQSGAAPCEHDYKAVVTAPTCTEQGYTTYTCAKCGKSYKGDEVAALGHDYQAAVTAPTCTAKGFTTYTCSRCGDSYTGSEVAALGHNWGEGVVTKAPTETAEGVRTYTCARCGEQRTEAIPVLSHEHSYTAAVTAPTCTEAGYTTHTCACSDSYVDSPVPALGHSFGEWGVTKAATCTDQGEETRVCSRCGERERKKLEALGHDYKAVVTAPTCTEAGFTTYTCSRCSDSYNADEVAALGHDYKDGVCTRCGAADPDYVSPINRAALQAAVAAAEKLDTSGYTDASVAAFTKALNDAKAALEADTQAAVDKAAADLDAAVKGLIEKTPFRFDDVKDESQYYFDPVYWAVDNGITTGATPTTFSPNTGCTRAQVVTFLWRAAGKPEPTTMANPFNDVKPDAYYYKAVLWAVEKGITTGTSATTFRPDQTCTRGQIVTFLWRFNEQPEPKSSTNPFTDVPAGQYYYKAVLWAVEKGITKGTSADKFSPDSTCTRAQIVTFLYRAKQ